MSPSPFNQRGNYVRRGICILTCSGYTFFLMAAKRRREKPCSNDDNWSVFNDVVSNGNSTYSVGHDDYLCVVFCLMDDCFYFLVTFTAKVVKICSLCCVDWLFFFLQEQYHLRYSFQSCLFPELSLLEQL